MRFPGAIFLGVVFAVAPLRADLSQKIPTVPGSGVTITASTPTMQMPQFGFLPMRVSIENATSGEHTWTLHFEVGQQHMFPGVLGSDFSLTVPAGQTRETWCYVPLATAGLPPAIVTAPSGMTLSSTPATSRPGPSQPQVKITSTPTSVKITRSFPSGMPFSGPMMEEEIDKATGARKTVMYSTTGTISNQSSSTPPAGSTITYTIDPSTGSVSTRISGSSSVPGAPTKVTITTVAGSSGMTGSGMTFTPSSNANTKVAIADTPTGKKVTRTTTLSSGTVMINETIFDTTTGKVTATTYDGNGNLMSTRPNQTPNAVPGTEVTFNIDPTTGTFGTTTRRIGGTAPPKYTVVVGRASPSYAVPSARWAQNSGMPPILIEVTGPGLVGAVRTPMSIGIGATPMRLFAVGQSLEAAVRKSLTLVVRNGAPSLSNVEPAQLPADWRVWSPFAGVILNAEDFAGLDPARRAALRSWVAMGGRLFLSPAFSGSAHTEKIGAGEITTWAEPIDKLTDAAASALAAPPTPTSLSTDAQRLAAVEAEVERRRQLREAAATGGTGATGGGILNGGTAGTLSAGNMIPAGGTLTLSSSNPTPVSASALVDFWIGAVKIYEGTPGNPDRDSLYLRKTKLAEAADRDDSSGSWLAVFLFVFAAVVAPLNLFVFAPAGKRHRLFWTTPLISAAGALLLALLIIFQDGFGGAGRRHTLVAFVPGGNEAAIFQEQALSTGFLTRRSFPLAGDTIMAELNLDDTQNFPADNRLHRAEGRGDGDWFRNRASEAQLLRRVAPTRGRVELVGLAADGAPIVQSSLGVALRDFSCVDETGKLWKTAELVPGKRVALERGRVWFAKLFAPKASRNFADVLAAAAPQTALRWGARGADSDLAPIATLDSIKWEPTDVLYTGALERNAPAKGAGQ